MHVILKIRLKPLKFIHKKFDIYIVSVGEWTKHIMWYRRMLFDQPDLMH